ncbi:MAG: flagellar hook-length control protein FliK [Bacillota bacterium]
MAGKIAAVSTGSASIAACAKVIPAPAKGVPTPNGDNKFKDALSRAMPAAKNTPSKAASAKNTASKKADAQSQPTQSTEAEPSNNATEAEVLTESAQSSDAAESAEAKKPAKPSGRKSSSSAKDQETSAASECSDVDRYADVTASGAIQANPTDVVPIDPSLPDVQASDTAPLPPEIQSIVPLGTQTAPDDSASGTAADLSDIGVPSAVDESSEEPSASAKSDVSIPAEQDRPVATGSGIPLEAVDAAEKGEVDASVTSELPPTSQELTARSAQGATSVHEEKRIPAAKADKLPMADPIISSESEQAPQTSFVDPAADVDGQSAQGNWAGDQFNATAGDQPLSSEVEQASAQPEFQLGDRVSADPAIVPGSTSHPSQSPKPVATPTQPSLESRFAEINHPKIVTAVRSELLPNGGTMQMRLDPPELGAMQVRVEMRDGVLAVSFQTVSDDATQLLSHSLHQLKTALESQGVSVERLHVEQVQREKLGGEMSEDGSQQQQPQDHASQQEQQRREMLQRMWRRLAGDNDPLDLMA